MKRIFAFLIVCSAFVGQMHAQVETHYYTQDKSASLRRAKRTNVDVKRMPSFDIDAYIEECEELERNTGICYFGKAFDVSYSLSDGRWEETDGGRLWSMTFASEGAYSLNFVFNDFSLPEGGELYVYNQVGSVAYGPVTSECLHENGFFMTDIISGNSCTITLFEPTEHEGASTLKIARVVHGIKNHFAFPEKSLTRANSAFNPNIACYPDYSLEADAVGLLFDSSAIRFFTGSLVMTTDYSFKPYFITSSVFVDRDYDGVFTDTEKSNAENCMVKFRSRYANCDDTTPMTSYTYNQAYFRAAHFGSRIALLELKSNLHGNPNLSWLGWVREYYPSNTSGAMIYHSSDNQQRIGFFDEGKIYPGGHAGGGYPSFHGYSVALNETKLYDGYTGAPVLNQNNRIIGIAYTAPWEDQYFPEKGAIFGKFDDAWFGGETDSTSLNHWLDPSYKEWATVASSRLMRIEGADKVISSRSYYVSNLPDYMWVKWSLSDSYYNENCLQQNYPENNHCTITRSSAQGMTNAVLTATVINCPSLLNGLMA